MLNAKILVVGDDPAFCQPLERVLRQEGAQVIVAGCCREALRDLDAERPDLILLDVMIPDEDGFETCERLRRRSTVPIIMLSAFDQVEFVVKGLRCGADDYIAKPVQLTVLLARIHAVLRRTAHARPAPHSPAKYLDDHLAIDPQLRCVWVDGEITRLSPIEFSLLVALVEHGGHPMTCQQILDEVWGGGHTNHSASVHVYISRLRHKIEPNPLAPRYVLTESGRGYRFETPRHAAPASA